MPRGRPKKYPVIEEPQTVQWWIAEICHMYCSMPGCSVKLHLEEASEIIDALKEKGYEIMELSNNG